MENEIEKGSVACYKCGKDVRNCPTWLERIELKSIFGTWQCAISCDHAPMNGIERIVRAMEVE